MSKTATEVPQGALISLSDQLTDAVGHAVAAAYPEQAGADPVIRPSDHADLQANVALALAKKVGANPRAVATAVVDALPAGDTLIANVEISGPGFLNLTLADAALWRQAQQMLGAARLGIGQTEAGRRTVIDYSAPNVAKEMQAHHLRTTIIGDALARVLRFLGGEVIPQNHLGDWGTQFGMLVQYLDEHPDAQWRHRDLSSESDRHANPVSALEQLYKDARALFDADPQFADRSRARVVAMQGGDEDTLVVWKEIVAESEYAFDAVYQRLGVGLSAADSAGESTYNTHLADIASELQASGLAELSEGALVVQSERVTGPDDKPAVLMVRKSDGGYGYDTTDLATIRYRIQELQADRILYVVSAPQSLHFQLIFEAARRAGWLTDDVDAVHVAFGSVLGPDGKPFKTRSGDSVRMMDLLDQAVAAAAAVVREGAENKGVDVSGEDLDRIAEQAGIGAVKYADLSTSRVKDYVFDPERMTAFNGNTGVYLQYAHTRLASIGRRAAERGIDLPDPAAVALDRALEPAERALILQLDGFGAAVQAVAQQFEPHRLAGYLYDLSRAFTEFYDACPVLTSEGAVRDRRLVLVALTQRTLATGLDLLGIAAPEQM